jgi:hypothetical protein
MGGPGRKARVLQVSRHPVGVHITVQILWRDGWRGNGIGVEQWGGGGQGMSR